MFNKLKTDWSLYTVCTGISKNWMLHRNIYGYHPRIVVTLSTIDIDQNVYWLKKYSFKRHALYKKWRLKK